MNRALSQRLEEEVPDRFRKAAHGFVGIHSATLIHEPPLYIDC
jgi:hypothetical protein